MNSNDRYQLTIAYDGSALEDGTMDVQELAPALLAIGELVNECNKVLNKRDDKIQVKVKAGFKKGSFMTEVVIQSKDWLDQIMTLMQPAFNIKEILELAGVIGGGGYGLFWVIDKIKGRKITKATQRSDDSVELIFEDGSNPVITNINVYNLYRDINVQKSAEKIVRPLKKDGIDEFYTVANNEKTTVTTKDAVRYFGMANQLEANNETLMLETETINIFKVITAQFEDGYKWRLSNGQDKITASLTDKAFLSSVELGDVAISKEDLFKVRLKTLQWKKADNSLRTENEITEVLEHIIPERPHQLSIPLEKIDE